MAEVAISFRDRPAFLGEARGRPALVLNGRSKWIWNWHQWVPLDAWPGFDG